VDVIGSEAKNDGRFTEDEKDAVYELGLVWFRPTIDNCISVTVEQRGRLLQKWGLIKVEKKGKKETPSTLTIEQLSDESARGYIVQTSGLSIQMNDNIIIDDDNPFMTKSKVCL
jgi:hypothetical protein